MVLGDNPPAFSSGSDASGDNSSSSSSGHGSDPTTPAAVSGAEDGSNNVICSSSDGLEHMAVPNGTASGHDGPTSPPENKLNDVAAQLAMVSPHDWEGTCAMSLADTLPASCDMPPRNLEHWPSGQDVAEVLAALENPDSRFRDEYMGVVNGGSCFNRLNDQYHGKSYRPITSAPDNFFPPPTDNQPSGLDQPTDNSHFAAMWDMGSMYPAPYRSRASRDSDPHGCSLSLSALTASGGPGGQIQSQGFPPTSSNPPPPPPHFGFQGPPFPPVTDHGGYLQGAEHPAAHESSGAQFHNGLGGGMPEGAVGGVSDVGGVSEGAGNHHTPSGRGKPTYTECVDVQTSEHVAEIVGRQGCKIKELRARTQTYIRTPTRDEPPIFTVTGVKDKVLIAAQEIREMAAHFTGIRDARRPRPNNPNEVHLKMPLETGLVGLVVGTRGATIKKIQEESGAYIVTPNRNENENHISTFSIRGQPHEVKKAEALIKEHINSRITPRDGFGGVMGRHRAESSQRAVLSRMIQGSSPPSPDGPMAGAGAPPPPPTNGFAAGNSMHSPPLGNSFNGIGSSSASLAANPDNGYGAHNGFGSRHSHNGPSTSMANGFGNDHGGDMGRPDRFSHGFFVPGMDTRASTGSLGSDPVNGSGSSSRSSALNGAGQGTGSSSFSSSTSSLSSNSSGLSSGVNGRVGPGSSARSPDRWNGATYGMGRNGERTNGTTGGSAVFGDWNHNLPIGRNGAFSHMFNSPLNGSSLARHDNAGLGPSTNGGGFISEMVSKRNGHATYNGATYNGATYNGATTYNGAGYNGASYNGARRDSGSYSYTEGGFGGSPFASSTPLNPGTASHLQNGMASGSGPFDGDGLSDEWSRLQNSSSFPRAYRRVSTEEQYPPLPFPGASGGSCGGGPTVSGLNGVDMFSHAGVDPLVPLTTSMNHFAPIGLSTTSSFRSDPSTSLTSAFPGSVLGGSSLLQQQQQQQQSDLWAAPGSSNGHSHHAFHDTGSKPLQEGDSGPLDLSTPFSCLRFTTAEQKHSSTTTTSIENACQEKSADTLDTEKDVSQQEMEEEKKREGADLEQKEEEVEHKSL